MLRYGRAVAAHLAAREEGRPAEPDVFAYARIRHSVNALSRDDAARSADIRRIRAIEEVAIHVRHVERALAAGVVTTAPAQRAALLALALEAFAARDGRALLLLEREASAIIEKVGPTARARCIPMHVLAVAEAVGIAKEAEVVGSAVETT